MNDAVWAACAPNLEGLPNLEGFEKFCGFGQNFSGQR